MNEPHPTAAGGFEAAADDYDRYRPGYPDELAERLRHDLDLRPGTVVLDLAAGTGKLTGHLAAPGVDVLAVEPVAAMRAHLQRSWPSIAVIDGTAEDLPLPDASLDAVAIAQAFHWFDHTAALAELHRVLRPSGRVAIVFNERDLDTPVQAALDEVLAPYRGSTPSWVDQSWLEALDAPPGFEVRVGPELRNEQRVDADGLLGRVRSVSFVALLDTPTRERLLAQCRRLFDQEQQDGSVTLEYRTRTWILRRSG